MNKLKGKTLIIGRDPQQSNLLVAVKANGQIKTTSIGSPKSVPQNVSRYKPSEEEEIAHCKIEIKQNGDAILTNLKPANKTYVNGVEIMSKRIDTDSHVTLGTSRHVIDIKAVLDAAEDLVGGQGENVTPPPPPPPAISIKHLSRVWSAYEDRLMEIKKEQIKRGKRRLWPMIIGTLSGLCSGIMMLGGDGVSKEFSFIPIIITGVSFIILIFMYLETDTSVEEIKELDDWLIDNYETHCCHHYLGKQPYKVIRQNKKCPYCGKPWSEK